MKILYQWVISIEFKNKGIYFHQLNELCDVFNLKNLIKAEICFTKNHISLIDLFFPNKPLSFQKNHVTEIGLNYYHRLIPIFFKSSFAKLRPKIIKCRYYRNFDVSKFFNYLNRINVRLDKKNTNQCYDFLTNSF